MREISDRTRGWYSSGLGEHVPAVTILGRGRCASGMVFVTRLGFAGSENLPDPANSSKAVSWGAYGAGSARRPETQAEAR
jgi:hypothetical protein